MVGRRADIHEQTKIQFGDSPGIILLQRTHFHLRVRIPRHCFFIVEMSSLLVSGSGKILSLMEIRLIAVSRSIK
jgi:hypothetical protein